jgi:hypothetical protein
MSTPLPAVRAAHLKSLVQALAALGPGPAAAVRAAVPDTLRRVEDAPRLAWLQAERLVELCEAARVAVGDAALEAWGAASLEVTLSAPLMRAFYEAALLVERRNPAVVLSFISQAWRLLYSGCGDLIVITQPTPREVRVVHAPVPPILRNPATVLPLVGALAAVPGTCGYRGKAVSEWTEASPRFMYVVRWE